MERLPDYLQAQLSDDTHGGVTSAAVVDYAIEAGDDEFDSYAAAAGLHVPLTGTIPGIVVQIVQELAVWHLRKRMHYVDETSRLLYEDARLWCRDLSSGKVKLSIDPQPDAASDCEALVTSSERMCSRTNFAGW